MKLIPRPTDDFVFPKGCCAERLTDEHWVLRRETYIERLAGFFIARDHWCVVGAWSYRVGNWLEGIAYHRGRVTGSG